MRCCFLFLAALLAAGMARADERILSFDSMAEVRADSSLLVTETIRVRAEGSEIRRGIFREFPTTYARADGSRTTVGFDVVSIKRDGAKEAYHVERRSNGVAVYIGQQDRYLAPGEYTYEIRYRTDRQLGFFVDHDELYWNVTGVGWAFPIDIARARVQLPNSLPPDAIRLEAYTGSAGAKRRNYVAHVEDGLAIFETTRPLAVQQGLTIVVSWPKGLVTAPGEVASALYLVRDNKPFAYAVLALLCVLAYYIVIWKRVGRDPPRGVVVPQYRPPEDESPASMRFLESMGYDNRCFVAGVLSLAVKGHLTIKEEPPRPLRKGKYVLQRTPGSTTPLSADEDVLLQEIFSISDSLRLDDNNYTVLQRAQRAHKSELRRRSLNNFFRLNGAWHALGVLLSFLAIGLGIVAPAMAGGFGVEWFLVTRPGWATSAVGLAVLLANWPFASLLRAPTRAGRKRLDEIEGFRLYLAVAEGDELKLAGAPRKTPGLFEMYLPFALALGVSQRWSEQFAEVFRMQARDNVSYTPSWYSGERWDMNDVSGFSSSLSSSFDSAVASASTAPGESSGSSGGSSGGGSSGGGGGGGGGGGW